MIFLSDPPKRLKNIENHGFDLDEAADCDWTGAVILPGYPGKRGEERFKAILPHRDDLVVVVFSRLGREAISVISMRRANRKERRHHGEG